MKRGIMATSLIVNYSYTDKDIDRTVEVFHEAFRVYRKALDEGIENTSSVGLLNLAGRSLIRIIFII